MFVEMIASSEESARGRLSIRPEYRYNRPRAMSSENRRFAGSEHRLGHLDAVNHHAVAIE